MQQRIGAVINRVDDQGFRGSGKQTLADRQELTTGVGTTAFALPTTLAGSTLTPHA